MKFCIIDLLYINLKFNGWIDKIHFWYIGQDQMTPGVKFGKMTPLTTFNQLTLGKMTPLITFNQKRISSTQPLFYIILSW